MDQYKHDPLWFDLHLIPEYSESMELVEFEHFWVLFWFLVLFFNLDHTWWCLWFSAQGSVLTLGDSSNYVGYLESNSGQLYPTSK